MMTPRYNSGGMIGGAILIALGVLFLLGQFFNLLAWGFVWPFFLIAVGALFFVGMLAGGKSMAGLAIPGTIIGVIGLILLFQYFTSYWTSWAYGWTIILMAVGLGIWIAGHWAGNPRQARAGVRVLEIGFVCFVVFGALFELLVFRNGDSPWRQAFFPILLILTGLYLIARRTIQWPRPTDSRPDRPAGDQPQPPQA